MCSHSPVQVQQNLFPSSTYGNAVSKRGNTVVTAVLYGQLSPPLPKRPNDGFYTVRVFAPFDFAEHTSANKLRVSHAALALRLENVLRSSDALELDKLSVADGEAVYLLHIELTVINADGNILPVCLDALTSLLANASVPELELSEESAGLPFSKTGKALNWVRKERFAQCNCFGVRRKEEIGTDNFLNTLKTRHETSNSVIIRNPTAYDLTDCYATISVAFIKNKRGVTVLDTYCNGNVSSWIIDECIRECKK